MNEQNKNCTLAEQAEFNASIDELFDKMFDEVEAGNVSLEQVDSFFPNEVRLRNS